MPDTDSNSIEEKLKGIDAYEQSWYRFDEFSYIAKCDFSERDVAALMACAEKWTSSSWHIDTNDDYFLPLHAWRALAELKAHEAISLLADLPFACAAHEDWTIEDIPWAMALMGEEAVPQLISIARERFAQSPTTLAIIDSLKHTVSGALEKCSLETRNAVVGFYRECLAESVANPVVVDSPELAADHPLLHRNASVLFAVLDLGLTELAPELEAAFSKNQIDHGMAGDWESVRKDLGVKGLGLPMPAEPINSLARWQKSLPVDADSRIPMTAQEKRADLKKRKKELAKMKKKKKRTRT
jgi:hypothetical protein